MARITQRRMRLDRRNDMRSGYPARSPLNRIAEVERAASLHDDRIVERHVAPVELGEVGHALAEEHRHQADPDLVDEPELQRLLDDGRAHDRDVLVAGELTGLLDRSFDGVDE